MPNGSPRKTHLVLATTTPAVKTPRTAIPDNCADVALIDAKTSAAVGQAGRSWWLAEVKAGRAPQPAIRRPRFTRWQLSQVREFWANLAKQGAAGNAARGVGAEAPARDAS